MIAGWKIDLSNHSGNISDACAARLVAMGLGGAILSCYDPAIFAQQYDAFARAGLTKDQIDGYTFLNFPGGKYYSVAAWAQVAQALVNMGGRECSLLWLDGEDEAAFALPVAENVAYMIEAIDACAGRINSGYYTRRDWHVRALGDTHEMHDRGLKLWDCTNDHTPDLGPANYGGYDVPYMEQYAFDIVVGTNEQSVDGILADLNVYGELAPVFEAVAAAPGPVDTHDAMTAVMLTVTATEVIGALAARNLNGFTVTNVTHDDTHLHIDIEGPWPLPPSLN